MKKQLGYYTPYLKVKQIKKDGKVIGDLTLTAHVYGYAIKLHYFDQAGYAVNEILPTEAKATQFFNKIYKEVQ